MWPPEKADSQWQWMGRLADANSNWQTYCYKHMCKEEKRIYAVLFPYSTMQLDLFKTGD